MLKLLCVLLLLVWNAGGDDSAVVRGFHRFNNSAARNWDRMKSTAGQAYSMTIKPLIDKLSGGQ